MKNIGFLIILIGLLTLSSCKEFLAEPPAVLADIQTTAQLRALLDNMNAGPRFMEEGNSTAVFGTDDYEIPSDIYSRNDTRFSIESSYYYTFNTDYIIGQQLDRFWNGEFNKIFSANLVLETVNTVSGSDEEKRQLIADAHFIRAYSYFSLVNYYCLPYSPENMQSLGLPLKTTRNYTESLVRSTLQETYDFILSDIEMARENCVHSDVQNTLRWRVSHAAIDAFLSRFYLFIGDSEQSIVFSNRALAYPGASLIDYNSLVAGVAVNYSNPNVTLNYSELNNWTAARFLNWSEFYYPRFTYNSSQLFIPSSDLLSLYDQINDLRFKWFMIPNGARKANIIDPAYHYAFFNDGRYMPSGPTIAEILLNKAEAAARTSDIPTAMSALNQLREARYKTGTNSTLVADNVDDALKIVLEERRREFPAVFRWVDIRRFSVNSYPGDDVTITRNFFQVNEGRVDITSPKVYTLEPGSLRYAVPINRTELINSNGEIIQNSY